jgi:hypothetical protein
MKGVDKEKIVRDLVGSFDSRDSLHLAYKAALKKLIYEAFFYLSEHMEEDSSKNDLMEFISDFVESTCRTSRDDN